MPHVLAHRRITDFDRWKEVFDRLGSTRAAASCRSTAVFSYREDPRNVVVLFELHGLARAQRYMSSDELHRAWWDDCVTDPGTPSALDAAEVEDE